MPTALRTPRLLLREWREEDAGRFAAMSAEPDVVKYLLPFPDRAASDAWIDWMRRQLREAGFSYWAVEIPGEADFIGTVGLNGAYAAGFPFAPAVEIGWRFAPAYWGRGYATEAARAVIDDGLGRLGLREIVAFTVAGNQRSWRVMQRLGMTRDPAEDFDHPALPEGHTLRRHMLYRIRR